MSGEDQTGPGGPMDRETMQAIEPRAGDELERTLARYARVRLQPGPAASRRARAVVMEAAWRAHIEAAPTNRRNRRRGLFSGWSPRRLGTAMAAAVLAGLLLGSSAFAASRAGGPLYGARIAFEDLTLPADPTARLEAQIANAQARLAEASDAEARHDEGALAAAVAAYGDSLAELQATTGPGAGRALQAVQFHLVVLEDLLSNAPETAVAGISRAVAASDSAIGHLSAAQGDGTTGGAPGGGSSGSGASGSGPSGGNPAPGGGNGGAGNGNGGPATTAAPVSTSAPVATPAPTKPPKPVHSANPASSPGPSATPGTAPTPTPTTAPDPKPTHAP